MRSKYLVLASALILVVALSACGTAPAQTRSLSVSGTGTVSLAPDIAYVNIGVHTEDADIALAVSSNNSLAQAVVTALQNSGVDAKDIQTSNFSVYTTQNYDKLTGQSLGGTSFVVDNTVYITVRDLNKLGSLLDTAIRAGANNINSVSFDLSDKTAGMQEARAKALANAGSLATELAKSAGLSLGAIQNLSYGENSPVYYAYGMGGGGAGAPAANVAAPINPGQIQLTATVSVTYDLK